ncbi:hypothetical protein EDB19DRAFT_2026902 [Suillus lakei]|nr:hypothetical protein EDB19DRAFT_2026902 [Suillus lakei]
MLAAFACIVQLVTALLSAVASRVNLKYLDFFQDLTIKRLGTALKYSVAAVIGHGEYPLRIFSVKVPIWNDIATQFLKRYRRVRDDRSIENVQVICKSCMNIKPGMYARGALRSARTYGPITHIRIFNQCLVFLNTPKAAS